MENKLSENKPKINLFISYANKNNKEHSVMDKDTKRMRGDKPYVLPS